MQKEFQVTLLLPEDYAIYKMGKKGDHYKHYDRKMMAETAEEVAERVKLLYPNYMVGEIVSTEDIKKEWEEKRESFKRFMEQEEERKAKARARKEEREKEKAKELGLTLEEYRAKVKLEKKIKKQTEEVERLREELAKAEQYLKTLKGE